jgi:hypothetical protein
MCKFYLNQLGNWLKVTALLLTFTVMYFGNVSAQYADCATALIVQGNTQFINPSGIGSKVEQLACGGKENNSAWIAFQAKASGKLNFVVRPYTLDGLPTTADFDWSLYALNGAPGVANCDAKTQLSCNYAGSSTVFGILGAAGMATPNYVATQFNPGIDVVSGNWYVLIVDQFVNTTPLVFNVQFTGNPESPYLNSSPGIFEDKPNFTSTLTAGCGGAYTFTNTSTATSGIASYLWNFGDGSTSTAANPSHTYITPGTYYVTLTMTDNNNYVTTIRKAISYNITPPIVSASGIFLTPSCTNSNNGTLTVTTTGATTLGVTGGTAPYTFELVSPSPMIVAPQSSNVFTGLQPGAYTVKVTDACGRTATNTVNVTQIATNSTIGLGIQNTQAACAGSATGTATLLANGSVPPYTFSLVNSSPVLAAPITAVQRDPLTATYYAAFTNLLPGLYTTEVTDGCGKQRRATFTVVPSTAPTANTVSSASCAGTPTGTLTVTATAATGLSANGTPGSFQYALIAPSPVIRPFQNSSVFENLYPGTYTIATKDACGNIGTSTSTISTAGNPVFGTTFTSSSCPNGATGTIEAQISNLGGGSPYTFELVAPSPMTRPSQATNGFSNLVPGTYTIRLTDVCGSSVSTTATIAASSAPSFATTLVPSCLTPNNGSITVIPSATSIGPFAFELVGPGAAIRASQGSNIANTTNSIFTNLPQGGYTIRMTDGCGTPITSSVTLAAPSAIIFPTGSTSTPSCASSATGRIVVTTPSTGSAPYQYELIAPSTISVAAQSSRIFDNLPTGNYTIRITDACGTQSTIGTPLTLATATAPALTVTNTASCATASGTITALASNSNQGGIYQYALISPSPVIRPNQTSPIFTGLVSGIYTVQITDQCGLTGTISTTITTAGSFIPAAGGSVASCNGSGYTSQIIVTNPQNYTPGGPIPVGSGGGPYTYAVYDATNTTLLAGPQSTNIFPMITPVAGNPSHTVRVTDGCGTTSITTIAINPPATLIAATITATTASCAASNTGVIKVSTSSAGGLPPYQYSLIDAVSSAVVLPPQSSTTFNLVPANATGYLVRTIDACGNVATSSTALLFPAAVTQTATVATTASCTSNPNGTITVTPSTASTFAGGTFSYSLYDAANTTLIKASQASPVFTGVAGNTYTVRITDRCGTDGTVSATVASATPTFSTSGTATGTCIGGNTGIIVASSTASGASLPITYALVDQATSAIIAGPQANNIFTGLTTGNYLVSGTDACGTVVNSATIALSNLTTTPTLSTSVALSCGGTAVIGAYGGGGNGGPYSYAICAGAGCTTFGSYSNSSQFAVSSSNTYRISVMDRCGNATSSSDIVVSIPSQANITSITKNVNCGPSTVNVAFSNLPNTPYYSVNGGNFSPTIGTLAVGTHTISVLDYNAGTFGCASNPSSVTIATFPIAYTLTGDGAYCNGGTGANVGLANSQTGVEYQLQIGGSNTGSVVAGTGSAISFGNQTAVGTYTAVATSTGSSCSTNMTGSLPVTILSSTTAPIATSAGAHFATTSCLEGTWSYFFENNKLLLGLEMGNWNPGTLVQTAPTTGQYAVRVDIGASPTANLTAAPYNTGGKDWIVMNRTWDVVLDSINQEPFDSIKVKTYFTDAEYQAVNNIFAAADSLTSPNALTVYKLKRTTPMWQDSAGASSITYDYSMQALNASHAGLGDSNLVLYNNLSHYAPDWVYSANSPSAGIHTATIKVDEFSGGGGGGGAGGSTPFPIKLLYFNGYNGGAINYLSWITATELNADKFVVERSADAITYKPIGEVKAIGNSNKQENYAFSDKTFNASQNFYRLKMLDKDGTFAYSNIIEIAADKPNITVYPNPAQNEVFIAGNFAPNFKASMINVLGAEVLNKKLDNQNQTAISLQNITPGVYMLNILNEKGAVIYSEKLVKE